MSTTYCLLYCCRMTITKPLYQPGATVAQRHIRRVAALRRRWLPVTALGLSLTGLHPDGLADLAASGRTPTLNAAAVISAYVWAGLHRRFGSGKCRGKSHAGPR